MSLSEPEHHGMVVSSLHRELIVPFVLFGLVFRDSFALFWFFGVLILIIGEAKSVVVKGALFYNTKHFGLIECFNYHLSYIVEEILMFNRSYFFCFKIYDVDVASGNVHNNNLPFVKHAEPIYNVGVDVFEENVSFYVHVNNAFCLSRFDDLRENKTVVKCS